MTTIDFVILVLCIISLGVMLGASKVLRAIVWEALRHPFESSRIEVRRGQIVVSRSQSKNVKDDQPTSPAGAR
jgi:hypothetical protein